MDVAVGVAAVELGHARQRRHEHDPVRLPRRDGCDDDDRRERALVLGDADVEDPQRGRFARDDLFRFQQRQGVGAVSARRLIGREDGFAMQWVVVLTSVLVLLSLTTIELVRSETVSSANSRLKGTVFQAADRKSVV